MKRGRAFSGDEMSPALVALEAKFAREDLEDAHVARMQRGAGLREPRRDIRCFEGFAGSGHFPW